MYVRNDLHLSALHRSETWCSFSLQGQRTLLICQVFIRSGRGGDSGGATRKNIYIYISHWVMGRTYLVTHSICRKNMTGKKAFIFINGSESNRSCISVLKVNYDQVFSFWTQHTHLEKVSLLRLGEKARLVAFSFMLTLILWVTAFCWACILTASSSFLGCEVICCEMAGDGWTLGFGFTGAFPGCTLDDVLFCWSEPGFCSASFSRLSRASRLLWSTGLSFCMLMTNTRDSFFSRTDFNLDGVCSSLRTGLLTSSDI